MTSLATVRHVSSSGRIDSWWQYCPVRKILIMQVKLGAVRFELDEVPICSMQNPRRMSWILVRKSGESWTVTPARWGDVLGASFAKGCAFHQDMPIGSLDLTQAPDNVSSELESL